MRLPVGTRIWSVIDDTVSSDVLSWLLNAAEKVNGNILLPDDTPVTVA